MGPSLDAPDERPANGLAGLKYWRQDMAAGLLVSLISLPFSLGIAVASGAPPIAGLISAIIAGLLLPFLGGSYMTISGPAAGLAPVLLASMLALGKGDLAVGYPLLLGVIALAGCIQIVLSLAKAARFSAMFPSTVVEAMLASIGLLIIAKQLPYFLGVPFKAHDFFEYLREAPAAIRRLDPVIFGVGVACLALIFALSATKARWTKVVPPQVVAVVFGVALARLLGIGGKALIQIPENPFAHGLVVPNFRGLVADPTLWVPAVVAVITLTLIDGVESLATASAIDRIDPFRRKSDPNRVLLAMGISNICSSVVGGLTIIPGGVKSKACIEAGGRTLWANFYNAIFLLLFLFVATRLINLIPMAALSAVLIHTGYKLCRPAIWRHTAHLGREQIALFTLTVVATLLTDLLWGIIIGVAAKLAMNVMLNSAHVQGVATGIGPEPEPAAAVRVDGGALVLAGPGGRGGMAGSLERASGLFRNPVFREESSGGTSHLYLGRPLVCFNSLQVNDALARVPRDAGRVVLHLTEGVTLIDHTSYDNLMHFAKDFEQAGRGRVEIEGLERFRCCSDDPSGLRISRSALGPGRRAGITALARFSLGVSDPPRPPAESLARMALIPDDRAEAVAGERPAG